MNKTICIVTATRAEYGLLNPLIKRIGKMKHYNLKLVVTGSHLSKQFGYTVDEIEKDGVLIDKKIDILLDSQSECAIGKSMGITLMEFSSYFQESKPDLVIILGDRYEMLAVASSAVSMRIPIAHLHGGETTEGAYDEFFRHAITKLSMLHFVSCQIHRDRVIQMGEAPERVFDVGAIGLENIRALELLTLEELETSIGHKLDKPFCLVTYHPVTLGRQTALSCVEALVNAIRRFEDMIFIITYANTDHGGYEINEYLKQVAKDNPDNILLFSSLGQLRYLSAMKHAVCVLGNSSSGIIEAPGFPVPTVNIGDRQKGRVRASSVIDCNEDDESIYSAICKANSKEFKDSLIYMKNPYGDGFVSDKIVDCIENWFAEGNVVMEKSFHDINHKVEGVHENR